MHVARTEKGIIAFQILTGKPTGRSYLERPIHRWEDNVTMCLKKINVCARNWIDSAQNRNYWRDL